MIYDMLHELEGELGRELVGDERYEVLSACVSVHNAATVLQTKLKLLGDLVPSCNCKMTLRS